MELLKASAFQKTGASVFPPKYETDTKSYHFQIFDRNDDGVLTRRELMDYLPTVSDYFYIFLAPLPPGFVYSAAA